MAGVSGYGGEAKMQEASLQIKKGHELLNV
jgi:hypothetical protein